MMQTLSHPNLGRLCGKVEDGIHSFYGLKYATLQHRFDQPAPILCYADELYNATKPGPIATSIPNACALEQKLIQCDIPHLEFEFSELESLNLSIHVPIKLAEHLPILVFIHGGGFVTGAHAWPQYDLKRIVHQSIKENSPIIAIGMNYRLGIPGFLYSKNLQVTGIRPNRGLSDQKVALQWIRRNAKGFGGDEGKITVIGESAGAVSLMHHLHNTEPLFAQMIVMSGSTSLMAPLPPPVVEIMYTNVLEALDINVQNADEQLRALQTASWDDLLRRVHPSILLAPSESSSTMGQFPSLRDWKEGAVELPGVTWCKRIVIGDCKLDGSIFAQLLESKQPNNAENFRQAATKAVGDDRELARLILGAYSMNSELGTQKANQAIIQFITDVGFYVPTICTAHSWPGRAFVYHFNEPNPWEGPFTGHATHILDIAFALQNYSDQLSEAQQTSARLMSRHFIKFVNEEDPFPLYRGLDSGGARVYGPEDEAGFIVSRDARSYGRNQEIWKLVDKVGPDTLMAVLQDFLGR